MKKLEKNFNEFKNTVDTVGRLVIPTRCTPFLGTKQRNFNEIEINHGMCLRKREALAKKTKLKISWNSKDINNRPEQNESSDANSDSATETESSLSLSSTTSEQINEIFLDSDIDDRVSITTTNIIDPIIIPSEQDRYNEETAENSRPTSCSDDNHSRSGSETSDLSNRNYILLEEQQTIREKGEKAKNTSRTSSASVEDSFKTLISYLGSNGSEVNSGIEIEILRGEPCPYMGIESYFSLLKSTEDKTFFLPPTFLNEILLDCKKVSKSKLQGFAYKKALKNPWKYTILDCATEFHLNRHHALPVSIITKLHG